MYRGHDFKVTKLLHGKYHSGYIEAYMCICRLASFLNLAALGLLSSRNEGKSD